MEVSISGMEPTTQGLPHVAGPHVMMLGLIYQMQLDQFTFRAPPVRENTWTKRTVLSYVQRMFDPIGLVGPVLVTGRAVFQDCWKARLAWDEPLTGPLAEKWESFLAAVTGIGAISFHRPMFPKGAVPGTEELHCFSDASQTAYGACVYLTVMDAGFKRTALVASRARLAHIKTLTVPRLELCGAVMAVDLVRDVKEVLNLADNMTVAAWTDSKTVLSWLKSTDLALRMFVANWVQKITIIVAPDC